MFTISNNVSREEQGKQPLDSITLDVANGM
jgi:hypothetical protein